MPRPTHPFVSTEEGWSYLAVVVDVFSRRVVGWAMSQDPDGKLVVEALRRAIELRRPPPGLIIHSDRGCQYASHDYRAKVTGCKARLSMSGTGNCYDNAMAESFFSTLDFEIRRHCDFQTHDEATRVLGDYIDNYYNRKRSHSSVDYMSPIEYEELQLSLD